MRQVVGFGAFLQLREIDLLAKRCIISPSLFFDRFSSLTLPNPASSIFLAQQNSPPFTISPPPTPLPPLNPPYCHILENLALSHFACMQAAPPRFNIPQTQHTHTPYFTSASPVSKLWFQVNGYSLEKKKRLSGIRAKEGSRNDWPDRTARA